jgi:hypothetical protein
MILYNLGCVRSPILIEGEAAGGILVHVQCCEGAPRY